MKPDRAKLYWSPKGVRLFRDGRLRDLGRMVCKENVRIWCRRHGVDFVECERGRDSVLPRPG